MKLQNNKSIFLFIAGAFLLGIIFLFLLGGFREKPQQVLLQEQEIPRGQLSGMNAMVSAVHAEENSLEIFQPKYQARFAVMLGEGTRLIRLVLPFDINDPPPGASFAPERKPITIRDIKQGDNVFIHSSHPIERGKDIVNPTEVQVLP